MIKVEGEHDASLGRREVAANAEASAAGSVTPAKSGHHRPESNADQIGRTM
jgi:hypothetical protein